MYIYKMKGTYIKSTEREENTRQEDDFDSVKRTKHKFEKQCHFVSVSVSATFTCNNERE